ncbi:hypothetical protein RJT34_16143 [Clitoria ternatea]|uniref:non-specific serine/threonine protein kinase n=1 Tax=Clitoria ternatea TaxID=43366 RepID=A0AAN9J6N8_CLITE
MPKPMPMNTWLFIPRPINRLGDKEYCGMILESGEPIGLRHFRPVKPLGSGDTGSVYLVELCGTIQYLAMKAMDKSVMLNRNKATKIQKKEPEVNVIVLANVIINCKSLTLQKSLEIVHVIALMVSSSAMFEYDVGGSIVGTIEGDIKGQTLEVGFLDDARKGAVTGAITTIELKNFSTIDEPYSKAVLLTSLLNGKVFMEGICPAVA